MRAPPLLDPVSRFYRDILSWACIEAKPRPRGDVGLALVDGQSGREIGRLHIYSLRRWHAQTSTGSGPGPKHGAPCSYFARHSHNAGSTRARDDCFILPWRGPRPFRGRVRCRRRGSRPCRRSRRARRRYRKFKHEQSRRGARAGADDALWDDPEEEESHEVVANVVEAAVVLVHPWRADINGARAKGQRRGSQ